MEENPFRKVIRVKDPGLFGVDNNKMNNNQLVGHTSYSITDRTEPNLKNVSHIVKAMYQESTHKGWVIGIEFLDTEFGNKAREEFDTIKSGLVDGSVNPEITNYGGTLAKFDLVMLRTPANPGTELIDRTKLLNIFSGINDEEALDRCIKYNEYVEIITSDNESWVQIVDGCDEDAILYDFIDGFGKNDGVFTLLKKLKITAKST
jgi:hypothetical protein